MCWTSSEPTVFNLCKNSIWYMFPIQCEKLRIDHLTSLLVVTMSYACWFLWWGDYIEDFKWRLHFQFGVAFWRVVLREVYFEGPNCVSRALKTLILDTAHRLPTHVGGGQQWISELCFTATSKCGPMSGESRRLVTDELVEFEKYPVQVREFKIIIDYFRGTIEYISNN